MSQEIDLTQVANNFQGRETRASTETEIEDQPSDSQILVNCRRVQVKFKDFSAEVRALMDVEQFANQAKIFIDVEPKPLRDIVGTMLSGVSINFYRILSK